MIEQAYLLRANYGDDAVERFYADSKSAMKNGITFTIAMGDINEKVGQKHKGERSMGNFGINSQRNERDALAG